MATTINKTFSPNDSKDVRYLNRDFSQMRDALISFTKTYYPQTYKDFSPSSPGMMFIQQAAYVGDVLGFYTDYMFKEGLLSTAQERKNIINLASYLGYKVKASRTSVGTIDIYQLCPAISDTLGNYTPDSTYLLQIGENSQFSSNNNTFFTLTQEVDFSINTVNSPLTQTVYSRNQDGTPQFFLLQKTGNVIGGQIYTKQVNIQGQTSNFSFSLDEDNVLEIIDMYDSDHNRWYEADYMAQELIPIAVNNNQQNSYSPYRDSVPYILEYISTSKKFVTSIDENNITTLTFGSGTNVVGDELVTLDSNLIGNGLRNISSINIPIDPSSFLNNDNYGTSPANTTLTVRYLVGGGLSSNCQVGEITNVISVNYGTSVGGLTPAQSDLMNTVKNSLKVSNSSPCVGGNGVETNDEIRMNATATFSGQNRTVTTSDYLARIYSLPPKFGSIAKAIVISNSSLNNNHTISTGTISSDNTVNISESLSRQFSTTNTNPFAINVYVLSYDANKNLIPTNPATIYNLMTYLKQYRILTDEINVIDGYVINIGVDVSISIYNGYNKQDVILDCLNAVTAFFNIDNWSFSQPINISVLQLAVASVMGVQSVSSINIYNKTITDGTYSPIEYNITSATKDNVIFPSIDPAVFQVKYPESDIKINIG
jgi:hypothetical protein